MSLPSLSLPQFGIGRSAVAAHTSAAGGGVPSGTDLAIFGDSISAMSETDGATLAQFPANGYLGWAMTLCEQRVDFVHANNFGVSGNTLAQMAARVGDVVASTAQTVIVLGGTNDLGAGVAATMFATWRDDIIAPLVAAGKFIIAGTIWPRGDLTSPQKAVREAFNTLVRNYVAGRSRMKLWDVDTTWDDGAGVAKSGYATDNLHPSMIGAYYAGVVLKPILEAWFPARSLPTGGALNPNPTLTGTGGGLTANTGITPTGQCPDFFRLIRSAGSSTATFVGAKTDANHERLSVDITGAGSAVEAYTMQMLPSLTTGFTTGDVVEGWCRVEMQEVPASLIGLEMQFAEVGPGAPKQAVAMTRVATYQMPAVQWSGILRTPRMTLQSGVTSISGYVRQVFDATGGAGNGEIIVSDFYVRKVT